MATRFELKRGNLASAGAVQKTMAQARAVTALMLALVLAASAQAGLVRFWTIEELERAPLLAVCEVESVAKAEPVVAGTVRWSGSYRWHEATLRVERIHSDLANAPLRGDRIVVRYVGFDDALGVRTGSPIWPTFEKGQRALFALLPSRERSDRWSLFADEGSGITMPAIQKEWRREDPAATPRGFILTELANALANGSATEQHSVSNFLRVSVRFPAEIQLFLDAAIAGDEERWLGVAAAIVTSLGIPRPGIAEIMSKPVEPNPFRGPILELLKHSLTQSGEQEFPDRLIRKLVDDSEAHAWGSATTLVEFKDSPVLIDRLRDALSRNQPGAVTIARTLVRHEQRAIIPDALPAALKLVTDPGPANIPELQAASSLIRDYGDDAQWGALVATVKRLKASDVANYQKLFGSASYSENKREIELAAVLIDDMREGFPPMRYCDVAANLLQRLSGQDFGVTPNMTRPDWDRAVSRAREWLATR